MKNKIRLLGFIYIIVIIGFVMHSCDDGKISTTNPCTSGHTSGVAATCETAQTCTVCNYVIKVAIGHNFGDDSDWIEDAEPASCEVPSHDTRDCKNALCIIRDKRIGSEPALGHNLSGAYPATCVATGSTGIGHCNRCNEDLTGEVIPINSEAHDFSGEPVITPAACEIAGKEVITCSNAGCNVKHETPIDALGHTTPQSKAATCTSTGLTGTGHCARCNEDLTGDVIPIDADNHDFGEWSQKSAATCIASERQVRVCSYNSAHTEEQDHGEINPSAHNWNNWIQTLASTCSAMGTEKRTCAYNATHTESGQIEINPDAHNFSILTLADTTITSLNSIGVIGICSYNASHTEMRSISLNEYITQKAAETNEPIELKINIELSTESNTTTAMYSGWRQLRDILTTTNKPVTLDLSECSFGTSKEFDTGTETAYPRPGLNTIVSIILPYTATSISNYAFRNCTNLTNVTIPDSVTSIGYQVFSGCTGFTSITIPDNVTSIGQQAFSGCTGLTSITIPNSVMSIGWDAFQNCNSLEIITIPFVGRSRTETSGGFREFRHIFSSIPTSLRTVIITDAAKIGIGAFDGCKDLTSITIPDSVTEIGNEAFRGCTGLTSITIPNSVTSIGLGAFQNCDSLESITIPFVGRLKTETETDTYMIRFGYIFGNTSSSSTTGPTGTTYQGTWTDNYYPRAYFHYFIPTSLKTVVITGDIRSAAFQNCKGLTSITIGNSVNNIYDNAFMNCTGLMSVTFDGSIPSGNFSSNNNFPGDLRTKYLSGGIGTYTRPDTTSTTWTKQN